MESDTESHAMIEGFRVTSRSTPEWLPASTAAVGFQIAVRAGDEWRSARIARVRPAGGVSKPPRSSCAVYDRILVVVRFLIPTPLLFSFCHFGSFTPLFLIILRKK